MNESGKCVDMSELLRETARELAGKKFSEISSELLRGRVGIYRNAEELPAPLPVPEDNPLFAIVGGKYYSVAPDGFLVPDTEMTAIDVGLDNPVFVGVAELGGEG